MTNNTRDEIAEGQLRRLVEDMAVQSMRSIKAEDSSAHEIFEQFGQFSRTSIKAELHELAALADEWLHRLKSTDSAHFESLLRDAVTQLQEHLETALNGKQTAAGTECVSIADPDLITDFILESKEHLINSEEQALALEKDPRNPEAINSIFRAFHSIKGLAAFLDFGRVYRFSHEVETLLDQARTGELVVTPAVVDIILASADFLSRCMDAIETRSLDSLPPLDVPIVQRIRAEIEGRFDTTTDTLRSHDLKPGTTDSSPNDPCAQSVAREARADEKLQPSANSGVPAESLQESNARKGSSVERNSIRVDTAKLDYLMDMVGELVIAESLVRTELSTGKHADPTILRNLAQLAQITSEVQRTTLGMRMIPIGQLMRRTARIVRDLSRKFGKPVEVELVGEDTEVDKTIVEELSDPLMHIVRNAIDHGVETEAQRVAAGKTPCSTIRIAASHEGSRIVVEVSDDGRGLDRAKILKKALKQNLVASEQLSDSDVADLIFKPGFSTAETLTTVSGRGVGMDVVRRHVEKLRGRVDVDSKQGCGTTFTIRLPLTRAIIDGLVVRVGGSRFVIPVGCVRELFRPTKSSLSTVQGKGELALLHNRLLPVVRLHRIFSIATALKDPTEGVLIVAESEGRQFCVLVDDLVGKQEVVVKSLGQYMNNTPDVSGATILGDGRVGLILDIQQIEARA